MNWLNLLVCILGILLCFAIGIFMFYIHAIFAGLFVIALGIAMTTLFIITLIK